MNAPENLQGLERAVATSLWRSKPVWLVHLVVNAGLILLAYTWLWISDATLWELALTALVAGVFFVVLLWLHGATLAHFRRLHSGQSAGFWRTLRGTLPRLPAITAWAMLAFLFWLLAAVLAAVLIVAAALSASALTGFFRTPISPETIGRMYLAFLRVAGWILLPLFLLPLASVVADEGRRGLGRRGWRLAWRACRRFRYWLNYFAVFLLGVYLPLWLINWVPSLEGLFSQSASLLVRFSLAYLLMVSSWLWLASLVGRLTGPSPFVPPLEDTPVPEPAGAEEESAAASAKLSADGV